MLLTVLLLMGLLSLLFVQNSGQSAQDGTTYNELGLPLSNSDIENVPQACLQTNRVEVFSQLMFPPSDVKLA